MPGGALLGMGGVAMEVAVTVGVVMTETGGEADMEDGMFVLVSVY